MLKKLIKKIFNNELVRRVYGIWFSWLSVCLNFFCEEVKVGLIFIIIKFLMLDFGI